MHPMVTRGRCGETEFLRAQHAGNGHIPAAHKLAVCFNPHMGAQAVSHQRLMHFGQPQLPRHAGVVDGVAGSRAGAAVVTGNQHDACTRFGDARRDGPDAGLRHQLDGNIRVVVGIFQVIDELR